MNGRVRRSLGHPLDEHGRRQAFAAAAIVLVASAVGLSLIARPDPPRSATPKPVPTAVSAPPSATAAARNRSRALPADIRRSVRRFLAGYLDRLYGRRQTRLRSVSRGLRRRLEVPTRVSPAVRRRHPRVTRLGGHRLAAGRWVVEAQVSDRSITYLVAVVVERRPNRVVVTRIVEE